MTQQTVGASQEIVQNAQPEQAVTEPITLMEVIAKASSDPNTDVEKLERLMALYERVEARQGEQAFNDAMNAAQEKIRPIAADASNSHTKSKYATYKALDRKLRPIYISSGFSLSFDTGDDAPENYVRVICLVSHSSGHTRTYHVDMPADGKGAQGKDVMTKTHAAGSAVTYGMRYLLKMIFNVAVGDDDDDGNGAGDTEECISEAQANDLIVRLDAAGADKIKFCTYMKVDWVGKLKQSQYASADAAIRVKEAEKQS